MLISVVIPTWNAERDLGPCLASIERQTIPREQLELFVVDDGSSDQTVRIAQQHSWIRILHSGARNPEVSKALALRESRGDFFMYLDADMELCGTEWFQHMLAPLHDDPHVSGAFTRQVARRTDPPINRYLSFDPLQRDPVYRWFTCAIEDVVLQWQNGYALCRYQLGKIPPAGLCLFRRSALDRAGINGTTPFMDLDNLVELVEAGCDRFAYVPAAGHYHRHASSLLELIQKRLRNLRHIYLPHVTDRRYRWFDTTKRSDLFKIGALIVYAHLVIPGGLAGIAQAIRHRDWAGLYEPIVLLALTDAILLGMLAHPEGRRLTWRGLRHLVCFPGAEP